LKAINLIRILEKVNLPTVYRTGYLFVNLCLINEDEIYIYTGHLLRVTMHVTPWSLAGIYARFKRTCDIHLQGRRES
jgi:hypothetical protein